MGLDSTRVTLTLRQIVALEGAVDYVVRKSDLGKWPYWKEVGQAAQRLEAARKRIEAKS